MSYKTLISSTTLAEHLKDVNWVIVDCRFNLADTEAGAYNYRHGHIPNARYAHLDKDLSSQITVKTGRHPLPCIITLCQKLGQWGINSNTQVIAYDDAGGAFAARLWWLLRYLGHDNVAVLDGGIQHWQQQNLPITTQLPKVQTTIFRPYLNENLRLSANQVENQLAQKTITLIDARAHERYSGQTEPLDPVAGHVPGAINRPFQLNLDKQGRFLPAEALQQQFSQLTGRQPPLQVAHMCGSGVTACHNLLAMEYAGLEGSKLYAGSWSEWITNRNHAVLSV